MFTQHPCSGPPPRIRRILPRLHFSARSAERDPGAEKCRWGSGTGGPEHGRVPVLDRLTQGCLLNKKTPTFSFYMHENNLKAPILDASKILVCKFITLLLI